MWAGRVIRRWWRMHTLPTSEKTLDEMGPFEVFSEEGQARLYALCKEKARAAGECWQCGGKLGAHDQEVCEPGYRPCAECGRPLEMRRRAGGHIDHTGAWVAGSGAAIAFSGGCVDGGGGGYARNMGLGHTIRKHARHAKHAVEKAADAVEDTATDAATAVVKTAEQLAEDTVSNAIEKLGQKIEAGVKNVGAEAEHGVKAASDKAGRGIRQVGHEVEGGVKEVGKTAIHEITAAEERAIDEIKKAPARAEALAKQAAEEAFGLLTSKLFKIAVQIARTSAPDTFSVGLGPVSFDIADIGGRIDTIQGWITHPPKSGGEIKDAIRALAPTSITISLEVQAAALVVTTSDASVSFAATYTTDKFITDYEKIMDLVAL